MSSMPRMPATPVRAWVRAPTPAYARCLRADEGSPEPDATLAAHQHAGYVAALRDAGIQVEMVPAAPAFPDACFVEDGAVIFGLGGVLTRPGAPSRREEVHSLAPALQPHVALGSLRDPATLDGGDVMRLGMRLVVGRSARTNAAGIEQLRAAAAREGLEVVSVQVPGESLHLKSVCSALDDRTVVADITRLPAELLREHGVEVLAVPEPLGANVLAFGDRVLVSADAPATARMLEARGLTVVPVALGELHRGDGALSCLSLRLPPPGQWSV